jgi:hypothetical protein
MGSAFFFAPSQAAQLNYSGFLKNGHFVSTTNRFGRRALGKYTGLTEYGSKPMHLRASIRSVASGLIPRLDRRRTSLPAAIPGIKPVSTMDSYVASGLIPRLDRRRTSLPAAIPGIKPVSTVDSYVASGLIPRSGLPLATFLASSQSLGWQSRGPVDFADAA